MEERLTGKYFFSVMNLQSVYQLSPNISEDSAYKEFDPDSTAGTTIKDEKGAFLDDGELIYSRDWNGLYTLR